MRVSAFCARIPLTIILTVSAIASAEAQGIGISIGAVSGWHDDYAKRFKAGDTNLPLLRIDWFSGCSTPPGGKEDMCCAWFCSVDKAGAADNGFCCVSNAHGRSGVLDKDQLKTLAEALNALQPPPKSAIPNGRKIFLSGLRSNGWFQAIYDRAAVPTEFKTLCRLTKTSIEGTHSDK